MNGREEPPKKGYLGLGDGSIIHKSGAVSVMAAGQRFGITVGIRRF